MINEQVQTSSLIDDLAEYAHDLDLKSAPDDVSKQAALCLLDTLGCIIAGSRAPEARALYRAERTLHGDPARWPADVTARVFGYCGDVFELNDLIGGHSSIGVITAVIAGASWKEITGRQALHSIVAGTEIAARLYESSVGRFKSYSDGGTVVVSYFNAIASAAALSLVNSLELSETRNAMSIAATVTSWCPAEVIFGQGGSIKPLLFGSNPAASAVQAVSYASEGITGPRLLLESPIGLMKSIAENFDAKVIKDTQLWYITTPQRKLHAACGYTHSSLDAVHSANLSMKEVDDLHRIEIAVPAFYKEAVGKVGVPASSNDARFHLGYLISLAVQGHYPILPEHTENYREFMSQARTLELAGKVRIVSDDHIQSCSSKPYNVSAVRMRFKDGTEKSCACSSPKGSAENPLSGQEVVSKFLSLVAPVTTRAAATELVRDVLELGGEEVFSNVVRRVRAITLEELGK